MKNAQNDYILYAFGTRGSRPVHGRKFEVFGGQTTCFVIKHNRHAVIIDCGTGLFDAEALLSDCDIIDIVFTHVHYDHVLGLLDFSIFPKNARINLIGTFKSWLGYETIDDFYRHPFWPVQPRIGMLCEITNDGHSYNLADGISLQAFNGNHPDNGNILLLNLNGKKVCFLFDFESNKEFDFGILKDTSFLVFDGMYDDTEISEHFGWGHSTFQEGCRLAAVYGCKELLITHHNPKNNDDKLLELEQKAKLIYPNTRFVRAGDLFVVE